MYQDLSVPIAFLKELRFREFHLVMASANPDILYKFESMERNGDAVLKKISLI